MCCIHSQKCNKCQKIWQEAYRPCSGLIHEGVCDPEECVGSFLQPVDPDQCPKCTPGCASTKKIMPQWRPIRRAPEPCEDCEDPNGKDATSVTAKDDPATSEGSDKASKVFKDKTARQKTTKEDHDLSTSNQNPFSMKECRSETLQAGEEIMADHQCQPNTLNTSVDMANAGPSDAVRQKFHLN